VYSYGVRRGSVAIATEMTASEQAGNGIRSVTTRPTDGPFTRSPSGRKSQWYRMAVQQAVGRRGIRSADASCRRR
jgi:hypothetical protein